MTYKESSKLLRVDVLDGRHLKGIMFSHKEEDFFNLIPHRKMIDALRALLNEAIRIQASHGPRKDV